VEVKGDGFASAYTSHLMSGEHQNLRRRRREMEEKKENEIYLWPRGIDLHLFSIAIRLSLLCGRTIRGLGRLLFPNAPHSVVFVKGSKCSERCSERCPERCVKRPVPM
jgi:hypothetical protein